MRAEQREQDMRCKACDATLDERGEICRVCGASQAAEADDRDTASVPPGPVRADTAQATMNRQERINFWTYIVCLAVCVAILLAVALSVVLT